MDEFLREDLFAQAEEDEEMDAPLEDEDMDDEDDESDMPADDEEQM